MSQFTPFQYILSGLSLIALWSAIPVSYNTWSNLAPCPNVGPIPACYIVTIGYLLIFFSSFMKNKISFYLGWSPVFILAAFGSGLEALNGNICPKTNTGTPMCYLSLALSLTCLCLFILITKRKS